MSRTYRRRNFNKKNRFLKIYWQSFTKKEIQDSFGDNHYKYHSDNYYNKHIQHLKSTYIKLSYKRIRFGYKKNLLTYVKNNVIEDFNYFLNRQSVINYIT